MSAPAAAPVYNRKNPFPAHLKVNRLLTGEGSEKETRHFEISLKDSGLEYECGDSIGVLPTNCPNLVEDLIKALHATGDEPVPTPSKETKPLRQALLEDYAITQPDKKFLKAIEERADATPTLSEMLHDPLRKNDLNDYLWGLEIIDFLHDHPSAKFTAEEFVGVLRKLQPRLYSIASSLKVHPEEVHLTIASVRYESNGRQRKGVASTFLAERATPETPIPVFVHTAKGFRLPEDGDTPIIMVGPGTGIAPFRAYIEERLAVGATGKNWLFFGEQRSKSDFFYQDEFEKAVSDGALKLTTAFSRDQDHKIYVQHRLMENAAEIWKWLEEGAHFYVCGDAARMAKDVDNALHKIAENEGGKDPEAAATYIEQLKKDKRYKRDVY